MSSPSHHFCVHWNNHQKNLLDVMSELLQNNTLTDVTLGVDDGRSVDCHKTILAACSSYFQTLFTQYPCKHPFVVLSGVKYTEIMRIVEFMYKGEVNVAEDELDSILKVAAALQVKGLVDANQWTPDVEPPPSPMINTKKFDGTNNVETAKTNKHRRKSYSPAYSTSKPYYAHDEITNERSTMGSQTWPMSQMIPTVPQDLPAASAAYQSSLSTRCPSVPDIHCENNVEAPSPRYRKRKMSREHVINRGTNYSRKDQGHEVERPAETAGTGGERSDEQHHRRSSNGSSGSSIKVEPEDPQNSVDLSCHRRDHDSTMVNCPDNNALSMSFGEETKSGISNYGSTQTHEGKRYKKYSRNDLTDAIMAVKQGMSANKAATLFKVPSRTLYDKIKKLGYTNAKSRCSRGNNSNNTSMSSSSACFPYGIGGNVDGSIYGNTMENENDNSTASIDVMDNSYENSRDPDNRPDESSIRENTSDPVDEKKSSSPRLESPSASSITSQSQQRPTTTNDDDNDCEAEDLSDAAILIQRMMESCTKKLLSSIQPKFRIFTDGRYRDCGNATVGFYLIDTSSRYSSGRNTEKEWQDVGCKMAEIMFEVFEEFSWCCGYFESNEMIHNLEISRTVTGRLSNENCI